MAQCQIQKCKTDDSDLQKINALARRELSADEIYVFNVTLCSNEVDRDYEKFSIESLKQLAPLFIGKTGISDHSMKSSDQKHAFSIHISKSRTDALLLTANRFAVLRQKRICSTTKKMPH